MKNNKMSLAILWGVTIATTAIIFLHKLLPGVFVSAFSFPFVQISTLLSGLAGTGRLGNGAALTILAGCISIPLILILAIDEIRLDRLSCAAGFVLTGVMGIGYYMLWNAGSFFSETILLAQGKAICFSAIGIMMWSGIIGFLAIIWIRRFQKSDTRKLIGYASAVLSIIGGVILAAACAPVMSAAADIAEKVDSVGALTVTLFCALFNLIPAIFNVLAIYAAAKALNAYRENDIETALSLAEITERRCIRALLFSVSVSLVCNITVLLFSRILHQTNTTAIIPLVEIVIVLAVLLISRLVQRNKQLADDNNLFI